MPGAASPRVAREIAERHEQALKRGHIGEWLAGTQGAVERRHADVSGGKRPVSSERRLQRLILRQRRLHLRRRRGQALLCDCGPDDLGEIMRLDRYRKLMAERSRVDSSEVDVAEIPQHTCRHEHVELRGACHSRWCHDVEARRQGCEFRDTVGHRVEPL
jgi:hypothetical protein